MVRSVKKSTEKKTKRRQQQWLDSSDSTEREGQARLRPAAGRGGGGSECLRVGRRESRGCLLFVGSAGRGGGGAAFNFFARRN